MHSTLLDNYIITCHANMSVLPVCAGMLKAIKETAPVAHKFDYKPQKGKLPTLPIKWPDAAMCLFTPHGFGGDGYYKFCIDVGHPHKELDAWFRNNLWVMYGAMVFQPSNIEFDVIPLIKLVNKLGLVMPEMQLHYTLTEQGWVSAKAKTGPVNAMFHDVLFNLLPMEYHARVDDNITQLGETVSGFLAAYYEYIRKRGNWNIHPAHQARGKTRGGKLIKIHKPATVGYKEYVLE